MSCLIVFLLSGMKDSLEGRVVWLQHGLVPQDGGSSSCAQVGGVGVDVVGRRTVELVHALQQKLLPVL